MERSKPSMMNRILGAVWYLVVCGLFLLVGTACGWLGQSKLLRSLGPTLQLPSPETAFQSHTQTILVLGCDQDYKESSYKQRLYTGESGVRRTPDASTVVPGSARTDMLMVVRMDFDRGQITGVSVPRDTWCRLPEDRETHKINAYYHNAAPGERADATRKAVEYLLKTPIDRTVVVNFEKMQGLVDLMGGVYVDVPREMNYDDNAGQLHIHLKPGYQWLDGYAAMGYVRFRHSDDGQPETDFQRQDRQRRMMLAMKNRAQQDWLALPRIVDVAAATIGDGLDRRQILALAGFMRKVGSDNIRIGVIPTEPEGRGLRLVASKLPGILAKYGLQTPGRAG